MTSLPAEQFIRRHDRLLRLAHGCRTQFPRTFAAVRRGFRPTWRRTTIRRYFADHRIAKVQIGAGTNVLAGWLNTDREPIAPGVIFLDAGRPLPFADASIDYLFSEHMIEHIPYARGVEFLRECRRVLKRGGQLRIATPNLLNLLRVYERPPSEAARRYLSSPQYDVLPGSESRACAVLNYFFRSWGHQFIYDPDTLRAALESAGFSGVRLCAVGESRDPNLRNLESHGSSIGEWNNRFETMVLEAVRPMSSALPARNGAAVASAR